MPNKLSGFGSSAKIAETKFLSPPLQIHEKPTQQLAYASQRKERIKYSSEDKIYVTKMRLPSFYADGLRLRGTNKSRLSVSEPDPSLFLAKKEFRFRSS